MRRRIPDLNDDHDEITLDHCYVLIEHLGKVFSQMEGTPDGVFGGIVDELNPEIMRDHLQSVFKTPEFSRLYKTEMGKGVLIGTFAKNLLDSINDESNEEAY